jgi:hypothetical protein
MFKVNKILQIFLISRAEPISSGQLKVVWKLFLFVGAQESHFIFWIAWYNTSKYLFSIRGDSESQRLLVEMCVIK